MFGRQCLARVMGGIRDLSRREGSNAEVLECLEHRYWMSEEMSE